MFLSDRLLVGLIAGLGLVLAGAVGTVFAHATWLRLKRRREKELLARGRHILTAIIGGQEVSRKDVRFLRGLSTGLQVRLFAEYSAVAGHRQRQAFSSLAMALGLLEKATALCRSRFWWLRLRGLRLHSLLGGGESFMTRLLHDPHPEVRAQAAEWSGEHPQTAVIDELLALLDDCTGLCRFTAQDSLRRMAGSAAGPLTRFLRSHTGRAAEGGLRVALGLADPRYLAPALGLCRDDSPAVRALAAKTIGGLGGGQAVEVLMGMLKDPVGEVRAAAAGALAALGHWPAAPALRALLRDPAWCARREAALALRALGPPGLLMLKKALSDQDPFASDIARQVLDLPAASAVQA